MLRDIGRERYRGGVGSAALVDEGKDSPREDEGLGDLGVRASRAVAAVSGCLVQ